MTLYDVKWGINEQMIEASDDVELMELFMEFHPGVRDEAVHFKEHHW